MGHTCGLDGDGLGCYTSGYGVKFPGFWAGAFYTTPDLGGLRIKVAALDPVMLGSDTMMSGATPISQEFARTPLPAFQVLAMYEAALGGHEDQAVLQRLLAAGGPGGQRHHARIRWAAGRAWTCTSGR